MLPHGLGEVSGIQIHDERLEPLFGGVKCDVDGVSGLADATLILRNDCGFHTHECSLVERIRVSFSG
ncbi:hypothetical protein D3C87_1133350 [compost metagenome]